MKKVKGFRKYSGLMFRTKHTDSLLFEFEEETTISIHSVCVFFPFLAIWKDKNDKIIESRTIFPFQLNIKPKRPFKKLIEIPIK